MSGQWEHHTNISEVGIRAQGLKDGLDSKTVERVREGEEVKLSDENTFISTGWRGEYT